MIPDHPDATVGAGGGVGGALTADEAARNALASLTKTLPASAQVAIAWRHARLGSGSAHNGTGDNALHRAVLARLDDAAATGPESESLIRRHDDDDRRLSLGIAFLEPPPDDWAIDAWFAIARDLVSVALRLAEADVRIVTLEKSKRLQKALYEISDLAGSGLEMREMLARIHRVVGELMPAENFYIVQYDERHRTIRYLYFADSRDAFDPDPDTEFSADHTMHSLTAALLRHGRPLLGAPRDIIERLEIPDDEYAGGPMSEDWLGVPLLRDGQVCGAIVVQDYEHAQRYGGEERALLDYVAMHIQTALDRKTAQVELERRVRQRTQALEHANLELQAEVHERQRGEKLQQALFRITELSTSAESLERFYADLHSIVGELLYARNFYIAFLSADGRRIEFPYAADEVDKRPHRDRERAKGLTEKKK